MPRSSDDEKAWPITQPTWTERAFLWSYQWGPPITALLAGFFLILIFMGVID